jgi:hypothetical protein
MHRRTRSMAKQMAKGYGFGPGKVVLWDVPCRQIAIDRCIKIDQALFNQLQSQTGGNGFADRSSCEHGLRLNGHPANLNMPKSSSICDLAIFDQTDCHSWTVVQGQPVLNGPPHIVSEDGVDRHNAFGQSLKTL